MKIHFVGIGGVGMSALAQLHAMSGDTVRFRPLNQQRLHRPCPMDVLKKIRYFPLCPRRQRH